MSFFQSDLLPPRLELVLYSHKCTMFASALGNIVHLCEWGTSCEGGAVSCCVGEHSVNHGWLCTGEDMYKAPWFCNSYEIVRKAHFNFNKVRKLHFRYTFIAQQLQNTYTHYIMLIFTSIHFTSHTHCPSLLLLCTLPHFQAFWSFFFHTSLLQHITHCN